MRALLPPRHPLALISFVVVLLFCSGCSAPDLTPDELVGTWRAVLDSPGGELPFGLAIEDSGGWLRAYAINGEEKAPFSSIEIDGRSVTLRFDWYDAEIAAEMSSEGVLRGRWRKTAAGGDDSALDFNATRGEAERFRTVEATGGGHDDIGGVWAVTFTDESGSEPARGEFSQADDGTVTGTFLTPTGDYRFLEGRYHDGVLRLSTFDGAHAFLFEARVQSDGRLEGDFWSRDTYHATWTAIRAEPGEVLLPDSWSLVGLTNDEGRFSFEFPDLDGDVVTSGDARFRGKVVLVNLFGSWCPNCNDEAPLLATWYKRFRDRGLEIVGLAYEFTGDPERDREVLRRFAERYSISYPLLLAGTSDKSDAAATLPDIDRVVAYPTTVFIGRDGRVRRIHSGFSGPGTGTHHAELVAELEGLIRELLAEAV